MYQKALDSLKDTTCDRINDCKKCSLTSYCGHYQCIKTLQEAINKANKYDEKETPKKPIRHSNSFYKCKNCDELFQNHHYQKHCPNCGQKLDWSDKDDN